MGRLLSEKGELINGFIDERVQELLPLLEDLATRKIKQREIGYGQGKSKKKGWKALAIQESVIFKHYYPDVNSDGSPKPESELTYRSAWAQISNLNKGLRKAAKTELKDHALYHPFLTVTNHFVETLYSMFSAYKVNSNIEYKKRVKERRKPENRQVIDLTSYLENAVSVLEAAKEDEKVHYTQVSCAVALCTGRRMAEVHLSAEFQPVGEYELIFRGQLKGKGRKVETDDGDEKLLRHAEFRIPTLVKADLVKFGLDWLDEKDKRFAKTEDPLRVNRRFSKPLSGTVKNDWDFLGDRETTYHKFRGAYFAANVATYEKPVTEFQDYATEIMGDDDMNTLASYICYEIAPGSKTRI